MRGSRFQNNEGSMLKNKKNLARFIAFLLAAGVAIAAFTVGVTQYIHRESGYYEVGITSEGWNALYGSGAHMILYASGNSSDIRRETNQAQKAFTDALLYAYRLLDAENEYEGVTNIATLNRHPGEPQAVGEELYAVLRDALERTRRGEGYSLFCGALHREWQALRYLEEPAPADPLNDPEEARRIAALTELTALPELTLSDPDTATLTVPPEYAAVLAKLELEAPSLDLNLLHDAYLLTITAKLLQNNGYTDAYLYTESGCSLWFGEGQGQFALYALEKDGPRTAAAARLALPVAYCQFTAFSPTGAQYDYYAVEKEGVTALRHPFIALDGSVPNVLQSAALAGEAGELVDLAYRLAVLCVQPDREAVFAALDALPDTVFYAALPLGERAIYARAADAEKIALAEGGQFALTLR